MLLLLELDDVVITTDEVDDDELDDVVGLAVSDTSPPVTL